MSYTYDEQLIDASGVRRQRLTGASLHGHNRLRRQFSNLAMTFLASALVATLGAAACVAVSFVIHLLAQQARV
ncbi:hypothetical protein BH23ACT6_BH23ACT6_11060 [soil metagenome]